MKSEVRSAMRPSPARAPPRSAPRGSPRSIPKPRPRAQDGFLRGQDGTGAAGAFLTPKASFIPAQGNALGQTAQNHSER
jgi:hypothetical protein